MKTTNSQRLKYALLAGLLLMLVGCQKSGYIQMTGYAQGGTWSVKYNTEGVSVRPSQVKTEIEAILTNIDTTLSGYNKKSQLSKFNEGETIEPNDLFIKMYDYGYKLWQETEGGLDFAAGPLFDIWGFGFNEGKTPSDEQVKRTLYISGMDRLKPTMEECIKDGHLWGPWMAIDRDSDEAIEDVLIYPQLNYNAVAQGLSCDMVAEYLYSIGVKDMLIDIGEIFCDGVNPNGDPWSIGVDRPFDGNNTPGAHLDGIWQSSGGPCGIVTSGNYRKYYVVDGVKYSHTIDPRTGYPVNHNLLSATIVAPTAAAADAYATYCMVLGLEKSHGAIDFILSRDDIEGYLIYSTKDGEMNEWASPGFKLKEQKEE